MKGPKKEDFFSRWQQNLIASPLDSEAVNLFIKDKEFGLEHS
jgi:hypothetical protein